MTVRAEYRVPAASAREPKTEINKRVEEVVAMLRIEHLLKRDPAR